MPKMRKLVCVRLAIFKHNAARKLRLELSIVITLLHNAFKLAMQSLYADKHIDKSTLQFNFVKKRAL